jgi:hypothetical protein
MPLPQTQPTIQVPELEIPKHRVRAATIQRIQAEAVEKARAEVAAQQAAQQLKPEQTLEMTRAALYILATAVRGDSPTDEECAMVNEPACMVLNKYPGASRWAPEIMLATTLVAVGKTMRDRGRVKREAERRVHETAGDSGRSRPQGVGQVGVGAPVS